MLARRQRKQCSRFSTQLCNSTTSGVSSKAQEATKLNFELANANKKKASRIARHEEAQRKFQIRAMKKKAKHKGK